MKVLVILAAFGAVATASPQQLVLGGIPQNFNYGYSALAPAVHYAAPAVVAPAVTKTQYHAQDELGQASYGHAEPGQAHAAFRDANGNVRGSYAYINPDGNEIRVNYVAGHGGFRAESNALPQAPVAVLVAPSPVQDTPEVVAAKAAHFQAVAEAQARSGRKKRGVAVAASPLAYNYNLGYPSVATYNYGAPALTYSAVSSPVIAHQAYAHQAYAHQAIAHPAVSPITYSAVAAPVAQTYAVAAPVAQTYAVATPVVAAAQPLREATLTKVVNTPGHAVSYRVD